jgi:hypothetical protein
MKAGNAMNRQDPPYRVRVDIDGAVGEANEGNNASSR